jgi:hypothetical protein
MKKCYCPFLLRLERSWMVRMFRFSPGCRIRIGTRLVDSNQRPSTGKFPVVSWLLLLALSISANFTALAQTSGVNPCTLEVEGATPPATFGATPPKSVNANVTCTTPATDSFISLDWGDGTFTTVSSATLATDHTYGLTPPSSYIVQVNQEDGNSEKFVSFPTVQTPSSTFSGQSTFVTAQVLASDSTAASKIAFDVKCGNVIDSNGHVFLDAKGLNIICKGQNLPLTVTNHSTTPTLITIEVSTSGPALQATSLRNFNSRYVAAFLFIPAFSFLLLRRSAKRIRRPSFLAVCVFFIVPLLVSSCGGSFRSPTITQTATPAGSYQVTVLTVCTSTTPDPTFVQTTLIVPLTVSPYQ